MSERHALASPDSWAEIRDHKELLSGDLMDVQDSLTADAQSQLIRQLRNALLATLITSWSFQLPLPSADPKALRLLAPGDYLALVKLVGPAQEYLFPADPEPETAEQAEEALKDPASPTPRGDV